MGSGRISECTPKLIKKAQDYLDRWEELGDAFPSKAGLFLHIGMYRATLYVWRKKEEKTEHHVAFLDIVKNLEEKQRRVLMNKGITGEFSGKICGVMLSQHGLYEKTEQKNTSETTITFQGALADLDAGGLPKLPNQGKSKQITDRNDALTLPEQDNLKLVGSGKGK